MLNRKKLYDIHITIGIEMSKPRFQVQIITAKVFLVSFNEFKRYFENLTFGEVLTLVFAVLFKKKT